MNTVELLSFALSIYLISALLSLVLGSTGSGWLGARVAALGAFVAGAAGTWSACQGLTFTPEIVSANLFNHTPVLFNTLNSLMLLLTSAVSLLCAIYAFSYLKSYIPKKAALIGCLMNMLSAAISLLVLTDNAVLFVALLELMTLFTALLVWQAQDEKARKAASLYWLMSRLGTVFIIAAFWILYRHSGTLALSEFHLATLSRGLASWVFVLGLLGFGIVSGLVPLHGWIPQVHSSAPSHAATLVSSVMLKVGLFGLLKLSIDWLGMPQLWWGAALMIIGALTAFIGGLYALMEHDIKRLLAYHTVENIGIILLGLSACVLGLALGKPTLAVLGLMAGLFHLVNHTLFKGVLFLGAGAVIRSTGAKDIEKLGGVARRMPLTATAMLIGLMSMAALPPLNGFVSEWFTYQTLFSLSHSSTLSMRIIAPLVMVVLAITGALAVMCVAKIFGVTFLGAPRSEGAANAGCAPASMLFSPVLLAIGCLAFGIGAPWVLPYMLKIAAGSLGLMLDPHQMTQGAVMISGTTNTTLLSTLMIAILLLAFPIIPLLLVGMYKNARLPRRRHGDAWACGYGHEAGMVVTATGFAQPLRVMFAPVYRLRQVFNPAPLFGGLLREGAMRIYPALAVIELALLLVAIFA